MEWIPDSLACKVRDWNRAQSRRNVVISIVLIASLLIGLTSWSIVESRPSSLLFAGCDFTEAQLMRFESAFAESQLSDYRFDEQRRVWVPKRKRNAYIKSLTKADALPQSVDEALAATAGSGSLLDSPSQRKQEIKVAEQNSLSRTIRQLEGIDDVVVYFDVQPGTGLHPKTTATATVVVNPAPNVSLAPRIIQSIRQIVAGAKVAIQPEDVVVTDLFTGYSYTGSSDSNNSLQSTDTLLARKQNWEKDWNEKIRGGLQHILDVGVVTHVKLGYADHQTDPRSSNSLEPLLSVTELAVSVSIPSHYYRDVWLKNHPSLANKPGVKPDRFEQQRIRDQTEADVRLLVHSLHPNPKVSVITVESLSSAPTATSRRVPAWLSRNSWIFTLVLGILAAGVALRWFKPDEPDAEWARAAVVGAESNGSDPYQHHDSEPKVLANETGVSFRGLGGRPDTGGKS